MQQILNIVSKGATLSSIEAMSAMELVCSPQTCPIKIAAFLAIIHTRKETEAELIGFIRYLRSQLIPVLSEHQLVLDTCGTGGDHANTFNISTASALLLASSGIKIAKHGGRAISSQCGSADVLKALNIPTQSNPQSARQTLDDLGFVFLLAPLFNHAYQVIKTLRTQLGIRTCFNLMGPLLNPLCVKRQVIGVYCKTLLRPLANILLQLGSEEVMLLHARDGLDELSINAPSEIIHLKADHIRKYTIYPDELGIKPAPLNALQGGNASVNAGIIKTIFNGKMGAPRDSVVLNTAAGLIVAGVATTFKEGIGIAKDTIDSGRAHLFLDELASN